MVHFGLRLSVNLSGHNWKPAETAEPIEVPFGVRLGWTKGIMYFVVAQIAQGKGQFGGHLLAHREVSGISGLQLIFSTLFGRWQQQSRFSVSKYTHTHTHTFNGPLSGTTQVSRYQKGKANLWHWHQLGHMQVCTLLQTDNHASNPPISFYRPDAIPATHPTASKH